MDSGESGRPIWAHTASSIPLCKMGWQSILLLSPPWVPTDDPLQPGQPKMSTAALIGPSLPVPRAFHVSLAMAFNKLNDGLKPSFGTTFSGGLDFVEVEHFVFQISHDPQEGHPGTGSFLDPEWADAAVPQGGRPWTNSLTCSDVPASKRCCDSHHTIYGVLCFLPSPKSGFFP